MTTTTTTTTTADALEYGVAHKDKSEPVNAPTPEAKAFLDLARKVVQVPKEEVEKAKRSGKREPKGGK